MKDSLLLKNEILALLNCILHHSLYTFLQQSLKKRVKKIPQGTHTKISVLQKNQDTKFFHTWCNP